MSSPAIYGGSRTKILTSKGLLLKDGTPIDYNGPKNYITKGTFATNATTGWELKRTTLSGLIPNQVAASWTTPSVLTLSATTTGTLTNSGYSLSLAASAATTAGDMLVSDAYTIDIEDQAKVLNFKFSYKAYANASNMNFSGTSSNTLHVYIYDVTNNAWIQPAGCYTMVQNSGVGIGYGTFQTPANMTQFRIALVSCNASAGAFTLYTDNFFVGPQQFNMGPPVTDWVSYTPSWTVISGTNPSIGNGTILGRKRRVGDTQEIEITIISGTTTTYGSGTYLFGLPTTELADTATTAAFGLITVYKNSSPFNSFNGVVALYSSSQLLASGTNSSNWTNTNPTTLDAATQGHAIKIKTSYKVAGWSSNTVMSSDLIYSDDVGSVHAFAVPSASPPAGYLYADGSAVNRTQYYELFAKIGTTFGSGDGSTTFNLPDLRGIFVRGAGSQTISGNTYSGTLGTKQTDQMQGHKHNDSGHGHTANFGTGGGTSGMGFYDFDYNTNERASIQTGYANLGDPTATTYGTPRIGTQTQPANIALTYFIKYVKGSTAQIAASETVSVRASRSTTQAVANGVTETTIIFTTVDHDSHGAYNSSTGIFTAPISGTYRISASALFDSAAWNSGNLNRIYAFKGSSVVGQTSVNCPNTGTYYPGSNSISTKVKLLAGEQASIRMLHGESSSRNIIASSNYNYVDIEKIGNY